MPRFIELLIEWIAPWFDPAADHRQHVRVVQVAEHGRRSANAANALITRREAMRSSFRRTDDRLARR
jgi:hypothetical protein